MKLSQWAKQEGISYITAYRWFKAGKIPNAKQLDSGTILVDAVWSDAEDKLRRIKKILEET
jgi:predicted site-specific integrase-resolvase